MTCNQDKIDETVLATLLLTLHDDNRAWKGHDFEVMDRLYERGIFQILRARVNRWL